MFDKIRNFFYKHGLQYYAIKSFVEWRNFLAGNPTFIKVGANDGVTGDPCGKALLNASRWTGSLIEPIPSLFESLSKNYSDVKRFKCYQVAISSDDGVASIYTVDDAAARDLSDLPYYWDQLASFVPGHIEKHLDGRLSPYVKEIEVETYKLSSFIDRNNLTRPTLLHIDTEGHDLEVLQSYDFAIGSPVAILIEIEHLSDRDAHELERILVDNRYKVILKGGMDIFAFLYYTDAVVCIGSAIRASLLHYRRERQRAAAVPESRHRKNRRR